jgi:hypothetical protein
MSSMGGSSSLGRTLLDRGDLVRAGDDVADPVGSRASGPTGYHREPWPPPIA